MTEQTKEAREVAHNVVHAEHVHGIHAAAAIIQSALDKARADERARVVELEAALEVAWKFGTRMRNASQLIGPYPNDRHLTKVWQRSLYHEGKDLHALMKPYRKPSNAATTTPAQEIE